MATNNTIELSFHNKSFKTKPTRKMIAQISNSMEEYICSKSDLKELAMRIGNDGCSWCPAVFNGNRCKDNFKSAQLIGLDFDGGISFDEVLNRSEEYMIPILFAYETFSSVNRSKFRVVILLNTQITDKVIYESIMLMLMEIFKGCDNACKDPARMFFGGKNLFFYNDNEPTLDLNTLKMNLDKFIHDSSGAKHYKEKKNRWYAKNNISSDGDFLLQSDSNIIELNKKSPSMQKRYNLHTVDNLKNCCRLFRQFVDDSEWLYYNELYGIMLNIIHIDNGKKFFLDTIKKSKYDTYQRDWTFFIKYVRSNKYLPKQCDNFCPYHESCPHKKNMLDTATVNMQDISFIGEQHYTSIEDVQKNLFEAFNTAMESDDDKIHVLKAQTSIGKTQMYINYLKITSQPCIIAVPTNNLKRQVYESCISAGINVAVTPSFDEIKSELPKNICEQLERLFNNGIYRLANSYIKELSDEYAILKEYLDEKEYIMNFGGHIITTHQRVLYSEQEWLDKYQIIIDEDIISTIIRSQYQLPLYKIERLLEDVKLPKKIAKYLNRILDLSREEELFTLSPKNSKKLVYDSEIGFNLYGLLNGRYFYTDGESLYFYLCHNLKPHKYVVLSATASEYLYNNFFGAENVCFHTCPIAKYAGNLIQHYKGTYSRAYIRQNEDIFNTIKEKHGEDSIITFKAFSDGNVLHIGNTEGINSLEGKDIAVVGTPHQPIFIYSLLALRMGYINKEAPHFREIIHHGYHFWFYTYKNELMRHIQLWLIESELEQCVGRARLLRNNCTVHLYSNYPLMQAQLVKE